MKRNWIIIYDIADNRRLAKVARIMEQYAVRVQNSAFEIYANKNTIEKIRTKLKGIINTAEDYVIYFQQCEQDWESKIKIGFGSEEKNYSADYYIL